MGKNTKKLTITRRKFVALTAAATPALILGCNGNKSDKFTISSIFWIELVLKMLIRDTAQGQARKTTFSTV